MTLTLIQRVSKQKVTNLKITTTAKTSQVSLFCTELQKQNKIQRLSYK